MDKMTYVSCINDVINGVALTQEHIDKLKALAARIDKESKRPHSASDKPTKKQTENETLSQAIFDEMEIGKAYSTSDAIANLTSCAGMTTQKVAPRLHDLVEKGLVTIETKKGKNLFTRSE